MDISQQNSTLTLLFVCVLAFAGSKVADATIINVPPDPAPGSTFGDMTLNVFEGGAIGSYFYAGDGSTVNIGGGTVGTHFDANSGSTVNLGGGTVGIFFNANSGSTLNISGGTMGDRLRALSGSTVNISGGTVGQRFVASPGSTVNIQGGTVAGNLEAVGAEVNISGGTVGGFDAFSGSTVTFSGVDYQIDGAAVPGLDLVGASRAVNFPIGALFSGTIADGTPFAFTIQVGNRVDDGTLTLIRSADLAAGPAVIQVPSDTAPLGVHDGQLLILGAGGALQDYFNAGAGSTVNIQGGTVGLSFEAVGAEVNISGGTVGGFVAFSGSTVNISGGTVGTRFDAKSGSTVTFSGVDFEINGTAVPGLDLVGASLPVNISSGALLSGTFADGTPFAFTSLDGDDVRNGTLTLIRSPDLPAGPTVIHVPSDPAPLGVHRGQSLFLGAGGTLPGDFNAGAGSTVNIQGGTVGFNFEAVGAEVNISGGTVGVGFDAFSGSTVNISGGAVGVGFDAFSGSTVNISGGEVGAEFDAYYGSRVNISGGSVGDEFDVLDSTVTLSGVDFQIDGAAVPGLDLVGASQTVNVRDGDLLSGTFADGTPFAFTDLDDDGVRLRTLTLIRSADVPAGPALIQVPSDPAPLGVHGGQTLFLGTGGALQDNFNAGAGSTVNIQDGTVGVNCEAVGAEVNVSGGTVGDHFDAFTGSTVNISDAPRRKLVPS